MGIAPRKHYRTLAALLLSFAFIMTALIPGTMAEEANQYTTIVLTENKAYDVGDEVTLEIRFYGRDALIDPTDINITLGYIPEWGMGRYIEVDMEADKVTTGVYRVTFIYEEGDYSQGSVICTKNDTRADTSSDTAMFMFNTAGGGNGAAAFLMDVTADKIWPKPGDTVRFTALFRNGTTNALEDPYEVSGDIEVNGADEDVDLVKDGTGKYHYEYSIPANATESLEIEFNAFFKETEDDWWTSLDDAEVYLQFYDIWLYTGSMTDAKFTGKIGVCDMNGKPVVADVTVTYEYENESDDDKELEITGTTGNDGLLAVTMDYPDIGQGEDIEVSIRATTNTGTRAGGYTQIARTDIEVYDGDAPSSYGFDVVSLFDEFVQRDSDETLEYIAYENGTPLSGTDIYFFFYDHFMRDTAETENDVEMGSVHTSGKATTDANGKFTVPFSTPDSETIITTLFKSDFGGTREGDGDWQVVDDILFVGTLFDMSQDDSFKITVDDFGFGKQVKVTVSGKDLNGGSGTIAIGPIDPAVTDFADILEFESLGWDRITDGPAMGNGEPFTGTGFSHDVIVPEFFPRDMNYVIMAGVWIDDPDDQVFMGTLYIRYIIVDKDGKFVSGNTGGTTGDDDDDDDDSPGFGIMLSAVALIGTASFVSRRKRQ